MTDFERVEQIVEELSSELKAMALFIHDHPELGMREEKACKAQAELLTKYGFTVKTGVYGFDTAYEAIYKGKKDGPKIAMLAEYDALPELGHGCGHNLIAMVAVGAGIAMREFADEYGGEIHVFGTPAEETIGGKIEMARKGAFKPMDVAMMSHPMDVSADCMNTMAMMPFRVKFYGKTAHAAAAPEEGINALDAAINFFNMVNALRQQTKDDARIHAVILNGGVAANIIPDYTEVELFVRANKISYLRPLAEKVLNCARAAALGTGCRMEYDKSAGEDFMDTNSNLTLAELSAKQLERLGVTVQRTGGVPVPGSSDMGDVSYSCPAIQNTFDMFGEEKFGAHTIEFTERAGTDEAMEAGLTFVKGHVLTAIELMKNPEHLKAIRKEFEESSK